MADPLPSTVGHSSIETVDIALSGGGFRATLFHLGVIACLRDHPARLLDRVDVICGVSGGSILAAHMKCHWQDYNGSDQAFQGRVQQLVDGIRSQDITGRVLGASAERLVDFKPLDSERLANEYIKLLDLPENGTRWDQLPASRPNLYVVATHLNTGRPGAFCREGFDIPPVRPEHRHHDLIDGFIKFARNEPIAHQSVARAVGASSAFPPVFSPLPLVPEVPGEMYMLTDGGVYDNTGVDYLSHLYDSPTRMGDASTRLVIASDASRDFATQLRGQYDRLLALALRVADVQGNRIAEADRSIAANEFGRSENRKLLTLSIHDRFKVEDNAGDNHSPRVQTLLSAIRTELDVFSAEEVFVLYRHGYRVASRALVAQGLTPAPAADTNWTPVDDGRIRSMTRAALEESLAASHTSGRAIKGILRRLVLMKIWKDYRRYVTAVFGVLALTLTIVAYAAYTFGQPTVETISTQSSGTVRTMQVAPYVESGWPKGYDNLVVQLRTPDVLIRQRRSGSREPPSEIAMVVHTVDFEPIASSKRGERYSAARLFVEWQKPISEAALYLFVLEDDGQEQRLVALKGSGSEYTLHSRGPGDRLVGLLVLPESAAPPNVPEFVKDNLTIRIEAP